MRKLSNGLVAVVPLTLMALLVSGCRGGTSGASDLGVAVDAVDGTGAVDAGSSIDPPPCGSVITTETLTLVPAEGLHYVRCATRGPQVGAAIALSADGRRLAVISDAGTVHLFATESWTELAQLAAPQGAIDAVAFSPDGATLATLSAEIGLVALWRAEDGGFARALPGPPASTINTLRSKLTYSPDGTLLATSLGTVLDVASGATVATFQGGTIYQLAFVTPNALFVELEYQSGNSPQTTRLSVFDLARGGAETVIYEMYSRTLQGSPAVSPNGRMVAVAVDYEGQIGGLAWGLHLWDFGELLAGLPHRTDTSFRGRVLGFSRDSAALFTAEGTDLRVLAAANLAEVSRLPWSGAAANFIAVSPTDDVVVAEAGVTSWWSTTSGAVRQTLARPLSAIVWAADNRLGAGVDGGNLFAMWREADAAEICVAPPTGGPAPALADLGTTLDANGHALSLDGSIEITTEFVIHTHSTNYTDVHVRRVATGEELRVFSPTREPRPLALKEPSAAELYSNEGGAVAVWCQ
jgi:WD40 repeat protein